MMVSNGPISTGGGGEALGKQVGGSGLGQAGSQAASKPRDLLPIVLAAAAVIELALFVPVAALLDHEHFVWSVSCADTPLYIKACKDLLATGSYPLDTVRTVGYPLFLAGAFLLGGEAHGYQVAVALQLVLNLAFLWLIWRLVERVAPQARLGVRLAIAIVGFIAGLGQAVFLLSDLQAGVFFTFFGYVMLCKRSPWWVVGGALALMAATLTRPMFTYFTVLIPLMAWLLGRFAIRVPWSHVAVYLLASVAAVGVNSAVDRRSRDLVGSDSFFTYHTRNLLYNLYRFPARTEQEHQALYQQEISRRAGKPYESLTRGEKDPFARALFLETLRAHPYQCARAWCVSFALYGVVPIESLVNYFCRLATWDEFWYHRSPLRRSMSFICMPLWILAYAPPWGRRRKYWPFYIVTMLLVVYVNGLCALGVGVGDRMRIPILPFMLAWAAVNLEAVWSAVFGPPGAAGKAAWRIRLRAITFRRPA